MAHGPSPEPSREPPASAPPSQDPSLAYLYRRLARLETRVRAAVERRRAVDPDPEDRFRGLYISDDQVDRLLRADDRPGAEIRAAVASTAAHDAAELAAAEVDADAAEAAGVGPATAQAGPDVRP